jgi:hypothetical protein
MRIGRRRRWWRRRRSRRRSGGTRSIGRAAPATGITHAREVADRSVGARPRRRDWKAAVTRRTRRGARCRAHQPAPVTRAVRKPDTRPTTSDVHAIGTLLRRIHWGRRGTLGPFAQRRRRARRRARPARANPRPARAGRRRRRPARTRRRRRCIRRATRDHEEHHNTRSHRPHVSIIRSSIAPRSRVARHGSGRTGSYSETGGPPMTICSRSRPPANRYETASDQP